MTAVGEEQQFMVHLVVDHTITKTVNPNGRGYEADNVTSQSSDTVLEVTIQASSADDARTKVAMLMALVEDA